MLFPVETLNQVSDDYLGKNWFSCQEANCLVLPISYLSQSHEKTLRLYVCKARRGRDLISFFVIDCSELHSVNP